MIKYIFTMAAVTYLIRMLPLTFFKKEITNRYIKAFLSFVPYAVLCAMTVPDIFYQTDKPAAAAAGFITALIFAYMEKSLLTVSLAACAAAFLISLIPA